MSNSLDPDKARQNVGPDLVQTVCKGYAFLPSAYIFFKLTFSEVPSGCQTVLTQIRPNILLGLIWVQTVCKGYQLLQTALADRDTSACAIIQLG